MGFNDRYKPGPNLANAKAQGATHILVECGKIGCGQKDRIALDKVRVGGKPAPRDVPVNYLRLSCPKCGSIHFSVELVKGPKPQAPVVVYCGWKLKHWPPQVMLRFACKKCPRQGQYSLRSLIDRYGADHQFGGLAATISADCPKRSSGAHYSDPCGAYHLGPSMDDLWAGRRRPKDFNLG